MKISALDNIRDTLEEGFDYEIKHEERYQLVALLQNIIDQYSYEERQQDIEIEVKVDR